VFLGILAEQMVRGILFLDILFREVPEGMEFLAVLLITLGSLGIMVVLGRWWAR
jgi:hypothetical protein